MSLIIRKQNFSFKNDLRFFAIILPSMFIILKCFNVLLSLWNEWPNIVSQAPMVWSYLMCSHLSTLIFGFPVLNPKCIVKQNCRTSCCSSAVTNSTSTCEDVGSIPSLAQWIKVLDCYELWSRSHMQFRSGVAGSCSSNSTSSLGTSIHCGCVPKKKKKKFQGLTWNVIFENDSPQDMFYT